MATLAVDDERMRMRTRMRTRTRMRQSGLGTAPNGQPRHPGAKLAWSSGEVSLRKIGAMPCKI